MSHINIWLDDQKSRWMPRSTDPRAYGLPKVFRVLEMAIQALNDISHPVIANMESLTQIADFEVDPEEDFFKIVTTNHEVNHV